ncbi:MAG TPA: DNA methyltransferase [Candidatus Saccharimonadales bacterium]|jgi:hypothetical protein
MPILSLNEIEHRATVFVGRWQGETYEKGESQSFWSEFLDIFGIDRKLHGAYFEYAVKKIDDRQGFIDMFWPGKLLAEQKSAGRDLSAANTQAFDYLHNLSEKDRPMYIIVSDFGHFELVNLETREKTAFTLEQLPKKIKLFGFLTGRDSSNPQEEDPVNRKAAETMARLHNQLRDSNYTGHDLELLLVRLVFCLFADDAGIFDRGTFERYLQHRTSSDGSDLGGKLTEIFQILNTPESERQTNLDQDLAELPYVNGGLFSEIVRTPSFTSSMRAELLAAADLDWGQVSPAIFGSMFQGVMDEKARRNLGAHYTSERNIMKVIKPLFLDDLYAEFETIARRVRDRQKLLSEFQDKLASLTFLDPACGCGNFLVITYRELRKLEHRVLEKLYKGQTGWLDTSEHGVVKVNVDQMNGIEIEEFPALIAETALWLTDHQMNLAYSQQSGSIFKRLPLTKRANIVNGNALTMAWGEVIEPGRLDYILGNPPFIGSKLMTIEQRAQVVAEFENIRGSGTLDFVTAWYAKATKYMEGNKAIQCAFVSTNSICQGEQVGVLWSYLLQKGLHINFAHQTFRWSNEGKGIAAVYCIIEGFSYTNLAVKRLYLYDDIRGDEKETLPKNINPYLVDAPDLVVTSRQKPICDVPPMSIGNKPIDGGNYLFTEQEKQAFLQSEPIAEPYFYKWVGSHEFIHRYYRWVLVLKDISPSVLRAMPHILHRVEAVRALRAESKSLPTQLLAKYPTRFHVANIPVAHYLVVPKVSSERRDYIPIGFLSPQTLASDLMFTVPNASLYHFGILTSRMHMAWVRAVGGRLKSDFRYSKDIVYNNFPWPENVSTEYKTKVEQLAQEILDARSEFPESSLADLYDPRTMPPSLVKAHQMLDKLVDNLYQPQYLPDDSARIAILLDLQK